MSQHNIVAGKRNMSCVSLWRIKASLLLSFLCCFGLSEAAPVADAGPDQAVIDGDEDGFAQVTLDASGSSDAMGTITSYSWFERGQLIATGVNPTRVFTSGVHTVTLRVTNDMDQTDEDEVLIDVVGIVLVSDIREVPDYNGNNAPEVASLKIYQSEDVSNERIFVQYNDAKNGAKISEFKYLNPDFAAAGLIVLPDAAPDGGTGVGVWAKRRSDDLNIIQIKSPLGGVFISNVYPLSRQWEIMQIAPVPGVAPDGRHGIAVLATRKSDGLAIVQIRNPQDNTVVRNVFPLGLGWTALSMAIIPDTGDGQAAVAVLSVRDSDNLTVVQIRDAATATLVRNVYPLGPTYTAREMITVFDANDDGVADIATRMVRNSDGLGVIQIRDAINGSLIRNIFPLPPPFSTREGTMVAIDNNSLSGLGLHSSRVGFSWVFQNKIIANGEVLQNSSIGQPSLIRVFDDMNGNGVSELAVLSRFNDLYRFQTWDPSTALMLVNQTINPPN